MKKYILILFFIFCALFLYGAPLDYAHLLAFDEVEKEFFEKFASGQELSYMICEEEFVNGEQIKDELAEKIFLDSFNNWLDKTKYYISETKREKEFKDILKIIDVKDRIKRLPCNTSENGEIELDADITVVYKADASEYCGDYVACFLLGQNAMIVSMLEGISEEMYTQFVTHELGHAWGLTDQYPGGMADGSFLYNSKIKRPSVMNDSKQVTCDDADGFITTIDRILGKKREFYSLCSDGVFIKNGQAVIKENETYTLKENYDYFDAEIKVSYDTEFISDYIIDMTLKNFILSEEGLDLIQAMGFNVTDLKTLGNAQVKIHGAALETFSEDDEFSYMRTPTGLWTLVLYIKDGSDFQPKQVITKEYFSMEDVPIITDLESNYSAYIFSYTVVPLVNYLPYIGDGTKEELRMKSFLNSLDFDFNFELPEEQIKDW